MTGADIAVLIIIFLALAAIGVFGYVLATTDANCYMVGKVVWCD